VPLAPAVALGMAIGRIGCFLSEQVGTPTTLPWGLRLSDATLARIPNCPYCVPGVALQHAFGTYMAYVAEVEVAKDGAVRVRRVVCAVDCGTPINPDTIQAQIQSGAMFGLTAALYGEITLKDGRVEQGNFDSYQILRMNEAPAVEVHMVKSAEPPGGLGEAGTSLIAPAVANAIFAATARRLRKMPVDQTILKA